jgi:hypothetical protein
MELSVLVSSHSHSLPLSLPTSFTHDADAGKLRKVRIFIVHLHADSPTSHSIQAPLKLQALRSFDMQMKPSSAYKRLRVSYIVLQTQHVSYVFRPHLWPSSGRRNTKDRYIEILQML